MRNLKLVGTNPFLQSYVDTDCDMWTFGVVLCAQLLFVNTFHLALLLQYWVSASSYHATYDAPS